MATYSYQVQRSDDGTTWTDIGTASGSFDPGDPPFSHEIPYIVQDADTGDYLRVKVTDSLGVVQYSPLAGPATGSGAGGGGSSSFEENSSVLTRPAFTPIRTRQFSTKAQLVQYIGELRAGDLLKPVPGVGLVDVSTASGAYALAISGKHLSGPTVIDLGVPAVNPWMDEGALPDLRTGDYARIRYTGTGASNGLLFNDNTNVYVYGGEISTGEYGGSAFRLFGPTSHCTLLDQYVSKAGGGGMAMHASAASGATGVGHESLTMRYRCDRYCMNGARDPHADKGTGIHGALVHGKGFYRNMKICVDAYNPCQPGEYSAGHTWPEGLGGSVIEVGEDENLDYSNNRWWARGRLCRMKPGFGTNPGSTSVQAIGGCIIIAYGHARLHGNVFEWVEGNDITGQAFNCGGGEWHEANPAIKVLHGRTHKTRQYMVPYRAPNTVDWPSGFGIDYQDLVAY